MRGEFKGLFIMKQIYNDALTELFSTTSRVYPYTSFVVLLWDSVTTEQSTVKGRFIC